MLQVFFQDLIQVEQSRLTVYQCDHDHAVVVLQLSMLIKSVESDLRVSILLQLDNDTHTVSVGFVSDG